MILVAIVGKHTLAVAKEFIKLTKHKLDDTIPLFTSDQLRHYFEAILDSYHIRQEFPKTGKRGSPRKFKKIPHPDLRYAQVVKHRENGKVVKVTRSVVFGSEKDVYSSAELLNKSDGTIGTINTSYVERNNLTFRQDNKRLARKTISYSKDKEELQHQVTFYTTYFNFVKTHTALKLRVTEPAPKKNTRRWLNRTPAMAAGVTDHVWSLRELLSYRVDKPTS